MSDNNSKKLVPLTQIVFGFSLGLVPFLLAAGSWAIADLLLLQSEGVSLREGLKVGYPFTAFMGPILGMAAYFQGIRLFSYRWQAMVSVAWIIIGSLCVVLWMSGVPASGFAKLLVAVLYGTAGVMLIGAERSRRQASEAT